jgi:hypothetical protein
MRWIFMCLIMLLMLTDFTGINPGLGPGLSVKNVLLYMCVMVLTFRMALSGGFKLRMPGLHMAWAVWIGYAILTYLAIAVVFKYPGYDPLVSAMALKAELIDYALFCFVIFYGVQNEDDYRFVLRALLGAVGIACVLTLTDLVGITGFGLKVGDRGAEADRVFGAFGHANETGSLLACMLPPLVAMVMSARGAFLKLWWIGLTVASAAVFILTVSRGSYVAVLVGYPVAAFMLRSLIPPGKIVSWGFGAIGAAFLGGVVAAIFNPALVTSILDRVLGIGTMGMSEASSGRSDIWGMAVNAMMDAPVSLLTGFGWNAWSTMPTHFVLHNTYLDQYFNLGLIGFAVYLGIEIMVILAAKRTAGISTGDFQRDMLACVFGMCALTIAVVFQNLYTPRPYLWMYAGLIMRGVVMLTDQAAAKAAPVKVSAPKLGVPAPVWRRA